MSVTFECGDKNALVAYLYEECEPELRDVISGHLTRCDSCSSEIDGLGWTSQPSGGLDASHAGARIPAAPAPSGSAVAVVACAAPRLGAGRGRRRHLRRWAVSRSGARSRCGSGSGFEPAAAGHRADDIVDTASRDDLVQLEERLKSAMTQIRTATPVRGSGHLQRRRDPEESGRRFLPRARSASGVSSRFVRSKWRAISRRSAASTWRPCGRRSGRFQG